MTPRSPLLSAPPQGAPASPAAPRGAPEPTVEEFFARFPWIPSRHQALERLPVDEVFSGFFP